MARSSTTRQPGDPALPGAGRKKLTPEVEKALDDLRALAPKAIEKIKLLLESEDEKVVAAMAKEILDRTYGRAVQPTDNVHSGSGGVPTVVTVEFVKAEHGK